jgi:hypothetical protein
MASFKPFFVGSPRAAAAAPELRWESRVSVAAPYDGTRGQ